MADNPAALPQAVQRALSEGLRTIQGQLGDVQESFEQVRESLQEAGRQGSADRFVALLPPLMHMQATGAALAASIEAVLRFVGMSTQWTGAALLGVPIAAPAAPAQAAEARAVVQEAPPPARPAPVVEAPPPPPPKKAPPVAAPPPRAAAAFDTSTLPEELQAVHKKAKRFAKVTVQELLMYHKNEVAKGRENRDLYQRLKDDIDKSKALYDERYQKIASHNIDYLYEELVRVLAENDPGALGDYPYTPRP